MTFQNTLDFAKGLDAKDALKISGIHFTYPSSTVMNLSILPATPWACNPRQHKIMYWMNWKTGPVLVWRVIFTQGSHGSVIMRSSGLLSKIVGAWPEEIVVMNQLTVNLHLLMVSFYRPTKERYKIICEAKAFPSDQYAFESQVRFHDWIRIVPLLKFRQGKENIVSAQKIFLLHKTTCKRNRVVIFGAVNITRGRYFDMQSITNAAHEAGACCGFDLAHAVGILNCMYTIGILILHVGAVINILTADPAV